MKLSNDQILIKQISLKLAEAEGYSEIVGGSLNLSKPYLKWALQPSFKIQRQNLHINNGQNTTGDFYIHLVGISWSKVGVLWEGMTFFVLPHQRASPSKFVSNAFQIWTGIGK